MLAAPEAVPVVTTKFNESEFAVENVTTMMLFPITVLPTERNPSPAVSSQIVTELPAPTLDGLKARYARSSQTNTGIVLSDDDADEGCPDVSFEANSGCVWVLTGFVVLLVAGCKFTKSTPVWFVNVELGWLPSDS